jgi:hypothetical protein
MLHRIENHITKQKQGKGKLCEVKDNLEVCVVGKGRAEQRGERGKSINMKWNMRILRPDPARI